MCDGLAEALAEEDEPDLVEAVGELSGANTETGTASSIALFREVADDDRDHRSASRPIVRPGGSSRTLPSASSTPGTKASRDVVSCLIVSVSPGPPKMTS